jgi:hypothetical protein
MKDFIEELQTEAKLRFGKELSAAEVATEFAKHGFEARIVHLKNLEKNDEPISGAHMRDAAKRQVFERALKDTHFRLAKISR